MAQSVKNWSANAGDCRFDPWVGKVPWRREWLPTPAFLPGEAPGQRSVAGGLESMRSQRVGQTEY